MRFVVPGLAAVALLGLAACANNPNRPTDTGNMAYPAPVPQGNIGAARPMGADTGSMNQPTASGGVFERESTTPDTGNMALPSRAQGNSGTTRRY